MKFNSGKEMYDFIKDGKDLYSPSEETYVFLYNGYDSICAYYFVSEEEAIQLNNMAVKENEYWAAFLGHRGSAIYDSLEYKTAKENHGRFSDDDTEDEALVWCEAMHKAYDWIEVPCEDFIEKLKERGNL